MKIFDNTSDLTLHERTHTDERLYKCVDCVKLFKRRRHVLKHRLEAHNSTSVQYGCGLCGEMFSTSCDAMCCFYQQYCV